MATEDFRRTRMTRRRFAGTAVCLAATSTLRVHAQGDDESPETFPWEQLDLNYLLLMIIHSESGEWATWALANVFARSGIAVFDEAVTAPIAPLAQPISPLSFQLWQLEPMVAELRDTSFRPASMFNDLFPTETEEGDTVPLVGELLAGYYGGGDTSGAEFSRIWADQFIDFDLVLDATTFPAPTAILSLLSGEILAEMQEAIGFTATRTVVGAASAVNFFQGSGLSLPGLPEVPQLPSGIAIEIPDVQTNTICSQSQNFITTVQQRIFSVLDAAASSTKDIPILGQIVGAIVEGVKAGISLIKKTMEAILEPILGVLRTIGAGLAVASMIVGTLSPWTVKVLHDPNRNRFGIDGEVVTGDIYVSAGGWDALPLPEVLRDCAAVAGVQLPEPTSNDAPVNLLVEQSELLITVDSTQLTLDVDANVSTSYVTGTEPANVAEGDEVIGIAWVTATVEREDLKHLRDQLMGLLFSPLPTLVSSIVRPLIGPIANDLSSKLISLATVSSTKPIFVTYHISPEDIAATPGATPNAQAVCPAGKYYVKDPLVATRMALPDGSEVSHTGTYIWNFRPDGRFELWAEDLHYTVIVSTSSGPLDSSSLVTGKGKGTWSTENGMITVTVTGGNLTATSVQGFSLPVTGAILTGSYTCGETLMVSVPLPEFGTAIWEFIPLK